jgi:NAD(P)-dependent dehydrogenase (short-subunit alcohol dehydrogenase family)
VNVVGPMRLTRALLDGMVKRGWGRIVNVSSGIAAAPGADARAVQRGPHGDDLACPGGAAEVDVPELPAPKRILRRWLSPVHRRKGGFMYPMMRPPARPEHGAEGADSVRGRL